MTEREWLAGQNPYKLWYTPQARDHRKRRLLACACARRVLSVVSDEPRAVALIEACERYADGPDEEGPKNWKAVLAARKALQTFPKWFGIAKGDRLRRGYAFDAIRAAASPDACGASSTLVWAQHAFRNLRSARGTERMVQLALSRDVFGNPFRPVSFPRALRTDTVVAIAQGMYESRDFSAMPILADALQDAGCDNDDTLGHARDPEQTHVRGCWVVDLVLGKA